MPMPRKRPLKDPNQPYAYFWVLGERVIYVGQGKNNRCRPLCKASWSGRSPKLINLLQRRASEIYVVVIPCSNRKEAIDAERELIKILKPVYNRAPQHGGWKGMHTDKGKENISKAQTGRETSEEVRQGRSERMRGNQLFAGHKHSEETKAKLSQASKGRPLSALGRRKSSERMKEFWRKKRDAS